MSHKKLPFRTELQNLGICPDSWAAARAAETEEKTDYFLARDLEDLVESAAYDRCIELNDGENLLDVWSILWHAISRWPLQPAGSPATA